MRRLLSLLLLVSITLASAERAEAQGYFKLNGLYALAGVVNPAVEFKISKHSAFQSEIVYSPWQSIKGHPFHFGIFMNEYRYYIKEANRGFYAAANLGMMGFHMSKPEFNNGKIGFQNRYCKGYGLMIGLAVGYEYKFANRWLLDVFFGYSFMESRYNGYSMDGVTHMTPHRPEWKEPEHPDPFNGSSEWLPNKVGLSIGILLFDPNKRK